MAYQRSAYGGREDAYMKTESLMPSRILAPTGAATDLDEVRMHARVAEVV